jgi:hypothetical protein
LVPVVQLVRVQAQVVVMQAKTVPHHHLLVRLTVVVRVLVVESPSVSWVAQVAQVEVAVATVVQAARVSAVKATMVLPQLVKVLAAVAAVQVAQVRVAQAEQAQQTITQAQPLPIPLAVMPQAQQQAEPTRVTAVKGRAPLLESMAPQVVLA